MQRSWATIAPMTGRVGVAIGWLMLLALGCADVARSAPPVARTPAFSGGTPTVRTGTPGQATPTAGSPRPLTLTEPLADPRPHVAVDDAGTAYVTWLMATDPTSGQPGGIGFCRLPRGAGACANPPSTRLIVPEKTYGPADDPAYNQDAGAGAYPLVLGDQLFILSTRAVTTYDTAAGESTTTTIAFASTDAGDSFTGGLPAGSGLVMATRPVAFGPDDNPLIGLLGVANGSLAGGGSAAFQSLAGGAFTAAAFPIPDAISGALAPLAGGGIAVAYATQGGGHLVRRFPGAAQPASIDAFSAPQATKGGTEQTALASGPKGLALATIGGASPKLNGRAVVTPLDGGPPVQLATKPADDVALASGGAAAGGPLIAAYHRTDDGSGAGLYIRTSTNGTSFGAPQRITAARQGVAHTDIAAAPDGGGFAVWQSGFGRATVHVAPFGPQGASPLPGLPGSTPGGGSAGGGSAGGEVAVTKECGRIAVAAVQVTIADGQTCFLPGVGANKGTSVSNAAVLYNGLRITPLGGAQIVLDIDKATKSVTLYTTGEATVDIPASQGGDIRIFQGKLEQKLTAKEGEPVLDLPKYPTFVHGFKVAGQLAPLAAGGGVRIPVDLDLGKQFLGLTGHAELVVRPAGGLDLDTLRIHADTLAIPPLVVRDLDVRWTREGSRWDGTAKVEIPGGASLDLAASFDSTSFSASAAYNLPFPGTTLFAPPPLVYLHQINAAVAVNRNGVPLTIGGGVQVGAIALAPGLYGLDLDGHVSLTFANPFVVRVEGTLEVLSALEVANAWVEANSDGYVRGHALMEVGDKDWAYLGLNADMAVGPPGFEARGKAEACIGIKFVSHCEALQAHASNKGLAGCTTFLGDAYTLSYKWGGAVSRYKGDTCWFTDVSIGLLGARAAAGARRHALQAPASAKVLSINAYTASGVPAVTVTDPTGAPVPLDGPGVSVDASESAHALAIDIDDPKPGRYVVVAQPGAPALTAVSGAVPAPAPKLRAELGRARGGQREIRYAITANADARVSFVERTRRGDMPLPATPGRSGTLRFRPQKQTGGRHVIVARLLDRDGVPISEQTVGRFDQPAPPALRAPKRVRVRKVGGALQVQVTPGSGLRTPFDVRVTYGDGGGTSALIPAGRRGIRVPGAPKSLTRQRPTRVSVRALDAAGRRSAPRTVRVRGDAGQRPARTRRR